MLDVDRTLQLAALECELSAALRDYEYFGTPALHETVCLTICALVDVMRALGLAPESVVITIKRIARRAGFGGPSTSGLRWNIADYDVRLEGFVSHAIRRYFHLSATSYLPLTQTPIALVC